MTPVSGLELLSTAVLLLDDRRHLGIGAGEEAGGRLDDGELAAELQVDRAELEADDAAADDEQALRDLLEGEIGRAHV